MVEGRRGGGTGVNRPPTIPGSGFKNIEQPERFRSLCELAARQWHSCAGVTVRWRRAWADGGLDSRRRGSDGGGAGRTGWVIYMDGQDAQDGGWSSRETGVWIPAGAGMTGVAREGRYGGAGRGQTGFGFPPGAGRTGEAREGRYRGGGRGQTGAWIPAGAGRTGGAGMTVEGWRIGTGWVIYMDVQDGGWSSRETGVWIPACAGMTGGAGMMVEGWRIGTGWVIYMDVQDVQDGGWSSRETGVWIPACAGMTGEARRDGMVAAGVGRRGFGFRAARE